MLEHELMLLNDVRAAVRKNPELFSEVVLYAQRGITENISEIKEHAMEMEKLALAFQCASTKRCTPAMTSWIDNVIKSLKSKSKWINLSD